jgi:hypothetical protein
MNAIPEKRALPLPHRGIDRELALLIGGALLLIVAGLIAIPLAAGRQPALGPETTPEGVVERFYQALYRGDYSAAHGYFSADTQRRVADIGGQIVAALVVLTIRAIARASGRAASTIAAEPRLLKRSRTLWRWPGRRS